MTQGDHGAGCSDQLNQEDSQDASGGGTLPPKTTRTIKLMEALLSDAECCS